MMKVQLILALGLAASCATNRLNVDSGWESVSLDVDAWYATLARDFDKDKDQKITVKDEVSQLELPNGAKVKGHYAISVLMQELALARAQKRSTLHLLRKQLIEHPVDRVSHQISDYYWQGLTRTVDKRGLEQILSDSKTASGGVYYIYTPYTDTQAFNYFRFLAHNLKDKKVRVRRLPKEVLASDVRRLDGKHGILTLKLSKQGNELQGVPFVVPGGRFNEMYGWDSYFIILGLLKDGKVELARSMVENLTYQIEHYGKVLNANRSYYLTRSQPPFTTRAIWAVYQHLPKGSASNQWYVQQMRWALREYKQVWMSAPRLTETGLSRYFDSGEGPCPEVEPGHYRHVLHPYARDKGMSDQAYIQELMENLRLNPNYPLGPDLSKFFKHDRAGRESGHDTTYRFDQRAADFLPVDLNSLLAQMETDFLNGTAQGLLPVSEFGSTATWKAALDRRKELIHKYLWDEDRDLYFDWDLQAQKRSTYLSATTFYPLWAQLVDKTHAIDLVKAALPRLEQEGGISGSDKVSPGRISPFRPQRQWDYPYGWAPHQMLIWQALEHYGMKADKNRLIYKWIKMIATLARDYNGVVPEKYDVVKRTHQVFAEYGNVGVDFSYITQEGFGWMNASYQVGLGQLDPELVVKLKDEVK